MKPTIAEIIKAAAIEFGVSPGHILGFSRERKYTVPRFAVYAIAHDAGFSYPRIAMAMGGRDKTSVIAGKLRAAFFAATDPDFAAIYEKLRLDLIGADKPVQFKSSRKS
jgi:chromosomal replication initiation ATPase DnaA